MATKEKSREYNIEAGSVKFTFDDGSSRTFYLSDYPEAMYRPLMLNGLSQKLADKYAGAKEAVASGKFPTKAAYQKAMTTAVHESLKAGAWRMVAERGESSSLILEAVSRAFGIDLATAQERWDGFTDEQKAKVKANPKVQKAVTEIKIERLNERKEALDDQDDDDTEEMFA